MRVYDETLASDGSDDLVGRELVADSLFADRYRILKFLGRGGMGAVYCAEDETLQEIVALKTLMLASSRATEDFRREVRLARRVTHPNVARTFDVGEHGRLHFLTMEYIDGQALDELLDKIPNGGRRLSLDETLRIGLGIATGLAAAHRARVVHRDLKPANVMVAKTGRVVLTDFGIARSANAGAVARHTGRLIGTPHYMAPEQIISGRSDERSDVFALGVILFELLTGELPWDGDTPLAVALSRLEQPAPDPRSLAELPDHVADLVNRCLAAEPDRRPSDASDLSARLRSLGNSPEMESSESADLSQPLYAPIANVSRTLAIVPFAYRGDPNHAYLGASLAEELIDRFSRTQDIRVLAYGATQNFNTRSDPAELTLLGAQVMIGGTIRYDDGRVRISSRLVDTTTGVQQWTGLFEGKFDDVFDLEESLGNRVAEALRVELDAVRYRGTAPLEAIELYLRGRRALRHELMTGANAAHELLARCVEIAPGFRPGLVAHAIASVHAWWSHDLDPGAERATAARASVGRARQLAPDLAETHLVSAMLSTQDGDFRSAARCLSRAIELAPTLPDAHMRLGAIQSEAGCVREATRRLELALELDPTLHMARLNLARMAILDARWAAAEVYIGKLATDLGQLNVAVALLRIRAALYRGDHERVAELATALSRQPKANARRSAWLYQLALTPNALPEPVLELLAARDSADSNARFTSMIRQLATEALSAAGHFDVSLDVLCSAADGPLIDVGWMDRCPLLDPLRQDGRFVDARARVFDRAAAIWS